MRSNLFAGQILAFAVLLPFATMAMAQTPPTTTREKRGDAEVTTYELKGEVDDVDGNSLIVKMDSGDVRTFNVPESRKFLVDGKQSTVHELVPGTKLTATVTTTETPVTIRTITVKTGKVWHVMGNVVILTLPDGENKQFIVNDNTRFTVNGKPATVRDLTKGTVVHAEKIVEEPVTEITMDTTVVGQAPEPAVAPAAEPAAEPPPEVAHTVPAETPPAPTEQNAAPQKPASHVPLIVGVLLVAGILVIWIRRRRKSGDVRG